MHNTLVVNKSNTNRFLTKTATGARLRDRSTPIDGEIIISAEDIEEIRAKVAVHALLIKIVFPLAIINSAAIVGLFVGLISIGGR